MNKDDRKFLDVVQAIEGAENDVDKILEAARLLRHEGESRRLTANQKFELIEYGILSAAVLAGLAILVCLFSLAR